MIAPPCDNPRCDLRATKVVAWMTDIYAGRRESFCYCDGHAEAAVALMLGASVTALTPQAGRCCWLTAALKALAPCLGRRVS